MSDVDRDEASRADERPDGWDAARSLLEIERARPGPADDVRAHLRDAIQSARRGDLKAKAPRFSPRARTIATAAVALAVGTVAGAWLGSRARETARPAEQFPTLPPPIVTSETPPPMSSGPAALPTSTRPAFSPRPVASAVRPSNAAEDRSTREQTLLDRARSALARGDTEDALAAVAVHEAEYPSGGLTEEREYLAIRALSLAGRADETRSRAMRFMKQYPKSVFFPAVERWAK